MRLVFPAWIGMLAVLEGCAMMKTNNPADLPFRVSAGLEHRREEFRKAVAAAKRIVDEFAAKNSWEEQARIRTFDAVEIFSTQEGLWERIIALHKLPADTRIPAAGLVAGIESRVLVAVSPEEYSRINPEYAANKDDWTRLLAHEMVHRLHVEALGGDEDAMGPTWFFEGFAMAGAGQKNIGAGIRFRSADEALSAISEFSSAKTHAGGSYETYAAAFRFFMERLPLKELVRRAGRQGFEDWLRSSDERR